MDVYGKLVAEFPNNSEYLIGRGNLHLELGLRNEAVADFRKIVEREPKNAAIKRKLDETLAAQKLEAEIANLCKAIESNPTDPAALRKLGIALLNQKKNDDALIVFRKVIEIEPNSSNNHNNLGVAFTRLQKPQEAISAYRKAIELDANNNRAHQNLASALLNTKDQAAALTAWRKVVELNPNDALAKNNVAWFLLTHDDVKQRRPQEALSLSRKAMELDPKSWVHLDTHSVAAYRNGSWQESLDSREKMIKLRKARTEDKFFLAMCLWQLGKKSEARKSNDEANAEFLKLPKPDSWLIEIKNEADSLLGTPSQVK